MKVSIIVAAACNYVIGKDNKMLWHLPEDLQRFKKITTGHHIIMGRKTFESIGKPLPNRTSIIVTRQEDYKAEGCIVVHSLKDAIKAVKNDDECFIIGGGEIFEQAIPLANKLYYSQINKFFDGDAFFPDHKFVGWTVLEREWVPRHDDNIHDVTYYTIEK